MKITKFEQSGFIFETRNGFRIAIDIGNKTSPETLANIKPVDIFLVSHIHGDHFDIQNIKILQPKQVFLSHECYNILYPKKSLISIGKHASFFDKRLPFNGFGTIMKNGFEFNFSEKEFSFKAFHVDHGPNITSVPKDNFGFLLDIEGEKVYFAGDIFFELNLDISGLEIDYVLIPVGGFYTFGPKEALNFVTKFKKIKNIIPMHYDKSPETKDEFITLARGSNFSVII